MLRESLTTPKPETKRGRRGIAIFALVGACCMALGLFGLHEATQTAVSDEAMHAHLTSLIDHHAFLKSQNEIIGDLIEEGVENQVAVVGAIGAIKMASTFAATHGPMIKGVGNVLKNVIWGEQVARKTVDPKKIDASFDNSKTFVAEIRKRFPKSYGIVAKLRQDLKLHHFDLANIIQDISLLADTTANDAHKTIRTLGLRNKLLKKGSLRASPEKDLKIWSMAIKSQVQSLEASVAKADLIIKVLSKLQKDVAKAQDNLETEIERIKKSLEASVKGLRAKFADLEQKMKSVGCVNNSGELLRAIFTFGIACAFDSPTKIKLQNVRASLREEEAILKAILKRMGYFDDLVDSAKELTHQAAGLLESTKKFRRVLADTASELKSDYTDADIAENMGDVDFANDFADELHNTLNTLLKECKRVSADCIRRKHAMERALTGLELDLGDKKEEEIVELDATDNALSKDFYGITNGCSNYFEATSAAVDAVQNAEFRNSIHALGKVKNTLLLNARESYGAVKNGLFDVLDAARDVQNDVESAQYRIETNAKKMRKYLDKRAMWKYQLKYSLSTAKNCVMDRKIVGDRVAVLEKHFSTYTHELLPAMQKEANQKMGRAHHAKLAECKKIDAAETKEPVEPKKTHFKPTSGLDAEEAEAAEAAHDAKEARAHHQWRQAHHQWQTSETMRRANLKTCKHESVRQAAEIAHFKEVAGAVTFASSAAPKAFPAKLAAAIEAYPGRVATAQAADGAMTAADQKAAQALNTAATKLAAAHQAAAVARGAKNQEVKKEMIHS